MRTRLLRNGFATSVIFKRQLSTHTEHKFVTNCFEFSATNCVLALRGGIKPALAFRFGEVCTSFREVLRAHQTYCNSCRSSFQLSVAGECRDGGPGFRGKSRRQ